MGAKIRAQSNLRAHFVDRVAPVGVGAVGQESAHLKGVDDALASGSRRERRLLHLRKSRLHHLERLLHHANLSCAIRKSNMMTQRFFASS